MKTTYTVKVKNGEMFTVVREGDKVTYAGIEYSREEAGAFFAALQTDADGEWLSNNFITIDMDDLAELEEEWSGAHVLATEERCMPLLPGDDFSAFVVNYAWLANDWEEAIDSCDWFGAVSRMVETYEGTAALDALKAAGARGLLACVRKAVELYCEREVVEFERLCNEIDCIGRALDMMSLSTIYVNAEGDSCGELEAAALEVCIQPMKVDAAEYVVQEMTLDGEVWGDPELIEYEGGNYYYHFTR